MQLTGSPSVAVKQAVHASRMGETRYAYRALVVRSLGKWPCPIRRWKNSINMSFIVGCLEMNWLWSVDNSEIARYVERSATNIRE
jgi:hypothetical protein